MASPVLSAGRELASVGGRAHDGRGEAGRVREGSSWYKAGRQGSRGQDSGDLEDSALFQVRDSSFIYIHSYPAALR